MMNNDVNPRTKYRWKILAFLFAATTINYWDRSILGVLGPTLKEHVFHWTDVDYANINIAFKLAYTIGLLTMGAVIDKLGVRKGYALSIIVWSCFGMLHALVTKSMGWIGFALARFGLGLGESGNFPAAIKTVAEWFPKKERALATGIFNAGANVGAVLAPLSISLIVLNDGTNWQFAFLVSGVLSALWVILWLKTYSNPSVNAKVNKAELNYILSDPGSDYQGEKIKWTRLLPLRETWAFAMVKIPDAVWWFYLFWGGFFLNAKFGLSLKGLAGPIMVIYLAADLGSVMGGWSSSFLIKRGWPINKARKITLFICALLVLPVIFAPQTESKWLAVSLIALAAASHQAWTANVFTIVSDVFPKRATASVVGIGGMVGAASGLLADLFLGQVLKNSGAVGYVYAFIIAGSLYMVVLGILHILMPRMTPLNEELKHTTVIN